MNYIQRAKKYRAKKRLGQNFLIDENIIKTIIETAQIREKDIVVEIGAGLGFVTEQLVKIAKEVVAIELDEDMIKELEKIEANNLKIVHGDILKTDISQFGEEIKIVANIPYYITSPILAHLLGETDDLDNKNRKSIKNIVMMSQLEAAQRICATEKSEGKAYGLLTILANFNAIVEMIAIVDSKSFYPSPKVKSAIIKFTVRENPLLKLTDYSFFRKVSKCCFGTRRKNIKNSLINGGFSKKAVIKTLTDLDIRENERGETLSIKRIGELSEKLKENI